MNQVLQKYASYFRVKIEQISVQHDHIHVLIRSPRHRQFHHFFRLSAGQMAKRFQQGGFLRALNATGAPANGTGLWKNRPFTRLIKRWRAYRIVRNYIQLNELEIRGRIPYRKNRLLGLSSGEWQILWRSTD